MSTDNSRKTIYVAGYPKSGTTWLTRLLGDALNCPTGASIPAHDATEPAAGGWDRPGPYIVRKGHYWLESYAGDEPVVPAAHRLRFAKLTDPVVFIVRDPRDIAVSAAHFHSRSIETVVDRMISGSSYNLPAWNMYAHQWMAFLRSYAQPKELRACFVRYEDLLHSPVHRLRFVLSQIDTGVEPWRIRTAVVRQSFHHVKKQVASHGDKMPGGKALNQKLLRKGQIGDWRGQLTGEPLRKLEGAFGETMKELGYEIGE